MRTLWITILIVAALGGQSIHAQDNKFIIEGKIKIEGGSANGTKIVIEKDGRRVKTIDASSRFEIPLDFQAVYIVSFEKEGYVTKKLRFDTHVPEERIEYGFMPFTFTVELFEQFDDVNMVVFNQPVGKIAYSELIDEFDYDTDYTKSIQTRIDQAMEEVEQAREEKVKKEAEAQAQQAKIDKEVQSLTSAAEKSAASGKYDEAIAKLKEAAKLKDSPEIQNKIEEIEKKKEENERKQQYDKLVAEADAAMANGDLENARKLFQQAGEVLGDASRVKAQIKKIDDQIAARQQQEKEFNDTKQQAKAAFDNGKFEEAIAAADKALGIKPDADLEKIKADAKAKLDELKAQQAEAQAKKEQAKSLIADGDKAMKQGDAQAALDLYEQARQIDPDADVDAKVSQAQAVLEEERKAEQEAKAKQAQAEKLIADARAALDGGDVKTARSLAEQAKELAGAEAIGQLIDDIAKAEKQAAEKQKEEEAKNKEFERLVAESRKAVDNGDLEGARSKLQAAAELYDDRPEIRELTAAIDAKAAEIEKKKEEEQQREQEFEQLLAGAQEALNAGDLDKAKQDFNEAAKIKSDKRIDDGLKQIEKREQELAEKQAEEESKKSRFNDLVAQGEAAAAAGEFDRAEKAYRDALAIQEDESVKQRLASLDEARKKAEQEAALQRKAAEENVRQQAFDEKIAEGDRLLQAADFEGARKSYLEAQAMMDNDLVKSKLDELNRQIEAQKEAEARLAEQKEKEQKSAEISDLIARADAAFAGDNLDEAEKLYRQAMELGENDRAPKQLKAIEDKRKELALRTEEEKKQLEAENQQLEKRKEYDKLVEKADEEFKLGNLDSAQDLYEQAAAMMPAEQYPVDQIAAIDQKRKTLVQQKEQSKLEAEAQKLAQFKELVDKGDEALAQGDLKLAKRSFNEALKIMDDDGVKEKLEQAEKLEKEAELKLAAQQAEEARNEEIAEQVARGDMLFKAGKLKDARDVYASALAMGADEQVEDKMRQIDEILASRARAKEEAASAAQALTEDRGNATKEISTVIEEESSKNQDPTPAQVSIEKETDAPRELRSRVAEGELETDTPPGSLSNGPVIISDIKVGEEALKTPSAQLTEEDKFDGMVKRAELEQAEAEEEKKREQLLEKYPVRKTVETDTVGNSVVTYVYINRGEFVTVYKKVKHSWGGEFYFIDDRPTNKRFWEHETQ
ncbi:MAG: hypothetical protein Kow0075_05650 [Salibacteraceae bacterium]